MMGVNKNRVLIKTDFDHNDKMVAIIGVLTDYIIPSSYILFTMLYFSLSFYFF